MSTTATPTREQIAAGIKMVQAIAEAIRELKEVPSGILYARVMAYLSLDEYEKIIAMLIRGGVIERDPSHLLRWILPPLEKKAPAANMHQSNTELRR